MVKIIIVVAFFSVLVGNVYSQQDALYSQYIFNYLVINPGYTGSRDVLSVTALYRRQWVGIPGAPTTMTITADAPIANERMGVGLSVYSDKIGVTSTTGVYGNYAYRVRLTNKGTLAFGASIGFDQYKGDFSSVFTNNSTPDQQFSGDVVTINPNVGLGLYYSTDRYYLSASIPHIFENRLDAGVASSKSYQLKHYFLGGGYVFQLSPNYSLKPSVLIRIVEGAPIQGDFNINFWMVNRIGVGVSYRTADSFVAMLELQPTNALRFGYAYDITTTNLSRYAGGTHEIILRYEFATNKKRIVTPRYF